MREIKGYFEEIMDPAFYQKQNVEDYLNIILLDEGTIIDPIQKLRQVYPNVLHLERQWDAMDLKNKNSFSAQKGENQSELALFESFYNQMTDRSFDDKKESIMKRIIGEVKKEVEK